MTTQHGIIAQSWQLNKNLGIIFQPLDVSQVPSREIDGTQYFLSPHAQDLEMKVGDIIYLKEAWSHGYVEGIGEVKTVARLTSPGIDVEPAETMPPEAAHYWFEIFSTGITTPRHIDNEDLFLAGFWPTKFYSRKDSGAIVGWSIATQRWNSMFSHLEAGSSVDPDRPIAMFFLKNIESPLVKEQAQCPLNTES